MPFNPQMSTWSIKPNAKVKTFVTLCEVQSDKAPIEITSPFQGIVKQLLIQEGKISTVGQELCVIGIDETLKQSHFRSSHQSSRGGREYE